MVEGEDRYTVFFLVFLLWVVNWPNQSLQKYTMIWIFTNPDDSVLIQENTGQWKPVFSHILCSELAQQQVPLYRGLPHANSYIFTFGFRVFERVEQLANFFLILMWWVILRSLISKKKKQSVNFEGIERFCIGWVLDFWVIILMRDNGH